MTNSGIEAIAAQRIQERHAEAARGRLAKAASAGSGRGHAWHIHLPRPTLHRHAHPAHTTRPALEA